MAINTDIQQKVFDLLSRSSNLSFVSAELESGGRLALTIGQRVTAEVMEVLPNNLVQVKVGTSQYKLELPMAARAGQSLEMTFVSSEPRTTFAVARQGVAAPPVLLSDASRLLALLVKSDMAADPQMRTSLQSVGDMLRRSSGEAGVLANLMDEALTYSAPGDGVTVASGRQSQPALNPDQFRLTQFESNASQILQNIARNSRFVLAEAASSPVSPLPLMPGDEVDAAVLGTLPGGRVFVQVAGASLELNMPRPVKEGDILRLTFISSQPTPIFAVPRMVQDVGPGMLSEAGRWLSVLEHSEGGVSNQQMFVLERLNTVLKSLPPDSPAFTAIKDEALTYDTLLRESRKAVDAKEQAGAAAITSQQPLLRSGNGIELSDDMAKLLQALIKGNRLALLEAINQQGIPTGFAPGQQVKAEVLALLGGGRFLVQVGKQMMEFSLPKTTVLGDRFSLFFIGEEPDPVFLMTRFGRPGDSKVSETGRWLSGFLGTSAKNLQVEETIGLLRTLLSGPPTDATEVSRKLQQGLKESGLFYESHLARWFGGEYSLDDLLQEPQGRLSGLKQGGAANLPLAVTGEGHLKAVNMAVTLEAMEAAFNKAGKVSDSESLVDRRGLSVVREQLESLQSGQVLYRGELFPGQQMQWSVNEREAHRNKKGQQERAWDTSLTVDLPGLGGVTARLKLDGNRVTLDIQAGQSDSAALLDSGRGKLVEQLQAAGLDAGEIRIRHEES